MPQPWKSPAETGWPPHERTAARPSLRMNFSWTLAGNVTYAAGQWLVLVLLARLADPGAVGQLALGTAIATPLFLFTGLQLRDTQATDAAGLFGFPDYLGVRCAGVALGLAAAAAAVAIAGYDRTTSLVVLAYAGARAAEALADVHYGLLQQHERMRPIARSLMLRGALNVLAFGGVLAAGGGVALAVLALAASSIAVLLGHDVRAAAPLLRATGQSRLPRLHPPTARRLVAISLPLGVVMLAVSLRTFLPRFFIERSSGIAELGAFAALSSLIVAGTLVVSALGQTTTPRLAREFHAGDLAAFRRIVARLLLVGAALGAAGVAVAAAAGRPILALVFGSAYADRADVLVWLMGVGALAYVASFLGYALTATRRFKVQLPLFASTALACAGGCALLVPRHGLVGAAAAWGGALAVEAVACWVLLEGALRRRAAGGRP